MYLLRMIREDKTSYNNNNKVYQTLFEANRDAIKRLSYGSITGYHIRSIHDSTRN